MLKSEEYIISQTCSKFSSQFSIDTVRLYVGWEELNDFDFDRLESLICGVKTKIGFIGSFKGFRIKKNDFGITLYGSISNYYLGRSVCIKQNELKEAFEKLGNELSLNLHLARLYRLDVNINFKTKEDVKRYNKHLFVRLSRFTRLEQDNGLTFRTRSLSLSIYDKTLELKNKSGIIISDWLRIELKVQSNVKKYYGISRVEELYITNNWQKILSLFRRYFLKVEKQNINKLQHPNSFAELKDYVIMKGIESLGGMSAFNRLIDQMGKNDSFTDRSQKYNARKKYSKIEALNDSTMHPLAQELEDEFNKLFLYTLDTN